MNESTDSISLTDFLLARLAEDEAEARGRQALRQAIPERERAAIDAMSRSMLDGRVASRLGDPAHILAECDAKRRIVSHMQIVAGIVGPRGDDARAVLTWLALPYVDHPDFREEWKS